MKWPYSDMVYTDWKTIPGGPYLKTPSSSSFSSLLNGFSYTAAGAPFCTRRVIKKLEVIVQGVLRCFRVRRDLLQDCLQQRNHLIPFGNYLYLVNIHKVSFFWVFFHSDDPKQSECETCSKLFRTMKSLRLLDLESSSSSSDFFWYFGWLFFFILISRRRSFAILITAKQIFWYLNEEAIDNLKLKRPLVVIIIQI